MGQLAWGDNCLVVILQMYNLNFKFQNHLQYFFHIVSLIYAAQLPIVIHDIISVGANLPFAIEV